MEIAIISGKGGTGKSSISAAFATLDGNVVLADCDVDAANLFLLFNPSTEEEEVYVAGHKAVINYSLCTGCGYCIDFCRFDAISSNNDMVVVSEVSCDGCFLCSHVCPEKAIDMIPNNKSRMYSGSFRNGKMVFGRLAPGEENSGKLVNMVRNKARKISEENGLEIIILDGPPGIGCPVISTITGVDRVVIITEPTISGLLDLQRAVGVSRKFNLPVYIIVNKFDLNFSMTLEIEKWCRNNGLVSAGRLGFDERMVTSMVMGKSIIEFDDNLEISKGIRKIWNRILN